MASFFRPLHHRTRDDSTFSNLPRNIDAVSKVHALLRKALGEQNMNTSIRSGHLRILSVDYRYVACNDIDGNWPLAKNAKTKFGKRGKTRGDQSGRALARM